MNTVSYPLDYQRTLERTILARLESLEAERRGAEAALMHAALERLRTGALGTCIRCGGQIPYLDVAANPGVRHCAACRSSS
jgi:RNA polymerase-binding transcription factor DksA